MEAITTLLLFIGVIIAWGAQQNKRAQKHKDELRHKKVIIKKGVEEDSKIESYTEDEDIRDRKLVGTVDVLKQHKEDRSLNRLNKIERLSVMKRAIIWSEILDRPISER